MKEVKSQHSIEKRLYQFDKTREFKGKCIDYLGGKCQRCGITCDAYSEIFDFHHEKKREHLITRMIGKWARHKQPTIDAALKSELDKCKLYCSNCHRKHHADERLDKIKRGVKIVNSGRKPDKKRRREAWKLREQGFTYQEIADKMNTSIQNAWYLVEKGKPQPVEP